MLTMKASHHDHFLIIFSIRHGECRDNWVCMICIHSTLVLLTILSLNWSSLGSHNKILDFTILYWFIHSFEQRTLWNWFGSIGENRKTGQSSNTNSQQVIWIIQVTGPDLCPCFLQDWTPHYSFLGWLCKAKLLSWEKQFIINIYDPRFSSDVECQTIDSCFIIYGSQENIFDFQGRVFIVVWILINFLGLKYIQRRGSSKDKARSKIIAWWYINIIDLWKFSCFVK